MANKDLKYQVSADVQGFVDGMKEAAYSTDTMEKRIQNLIDDTPNVRKAFIAAKKEAQQLASAFMQLSDIEKQSAPGRQLAEDLQQAMGRAAELQDVIADTNKSIKNLSEDQQAINALSDAFSTLGSSISAGLGVVAMMTGKQEDFNKAIAAFTTIQSAANAILKIKNMLQKESNVMLAIGNIQTKALAKATELQTAATGKATIAQKLFNTVAKANPYVLLASAVLAVGAALTTFVVMSNKAKKAHEEQKRALEAEKEATDAYKNSLNNSLGSAMVSYKTLQAAWKNCNTELAKTQFIKEHQSEFKKLGIEVKNSADAEKTFETNTDDVVAGLIKRAKAAAKAAQAQVYYGQAIAKSIELEEMQTQKERDKANAKDEYSTIGSSTTGYAQTVVTKTKQQKQEEIEQEYIKKRKKAQEEIEALNKKGDKLITEAVEEGYGSSSSSSSSKVTKATKEQQTHLQKLQNAVKDYQKQLEDLDETDPNFGIKRDELIKKIKEAEQAVKDYKIAIGIETPKTELEQYEEDLKKELKDAEDAYKLAIKNDDKAAQEAAEQAYKIAQEKLDKLKVKIKAEIDRESIDKEINNVMKSLQPDDHYNYDFSFLPPDFADKADEAQNRLNKLIDARKRLNEIAEQNKDGETQARIQSELAKTDAEYQKLIKDVEAFNQASSKIKEREKDFQNFTNVVGTMNDVVGSIDGVVSSIQNLTKAFSEDASGWEKFMAIWQTAMSIMQAITTVMTLINGIQDIMNAKKAISGAVVTKEAVAQTALTTAQGTGIGTTLGFAAAQAAALAPTLAMATALKQLAAAQIFAAHAYIPFAGVGIASGMVATMESVMASIIAFAEGGIVPGGKALHDNRLAMVSSGEMILNQRQQNNLFKAIDDGLLGGGGATKVEVTGVVRGKDLLLVQKNYNTFARKSGQNINI